MLLAYSPLRTISSLGESELKQLTPQRVQQMITAREVKDLAGLERYIAGGTLVGQGSSAQSMLYCAIFAGLSGSIVEWIIGCKADVNWAQEGTKETALHLAVRMGSDHAKLLVRNGASVSAKNAKHQAPLEQEAVTDAVHVSLLEASRERSLMSVICPVCLRKSYGFTCQVCGETCRLVPHNVLEKQIGKGGFGILLLGDDYGMPSHPPRVMKRCDPRDTRARRCAMLRLPSRSSFGLNCQGRMVLV